MHYLFADCLLDTQLCTLYRAGQAVPLRPKAFHVLRYLLEHCNHLVSKEELCAHVWPDQFISDATIEGCIKCVRQAIGDTGRKQQLIHTRRGYGYRFVGAVEERREAPTAPLGLAPVAARQDAIPPDCRGRTPQRRALAPCHPRRALPSPTGLPQSSLGMACPAASANWSRC
jgi:DNA-binding winged helix-turn-helix (wHTH) protein